MEIVCISCGGHFIKKTRNHVHCNRDVCYKRRTAEKRLLSIRWKVLKRDDFTCQYCGRKAPNVELHVDHKVPRGFSGVTWDFGDGKRIGVWDEDNLITSCRDCNLGKQDDVLLKKHYENKEKS